MAKHLFNLVGQISTKFKRDYRLSTNPKVLKFKLNHSKKCKYSNKVFFSDFFSFIRIIFYIKFAKNVNNKDVKI